MDKVLKSEEMPEASKNCPFCNYVKKLNQTNVSRETSNIKTL